jgi:GAF domain
MSTRPDIGQAIAAAARSINHKRTLDDTLQAIVEVAQASVPGFDEVRISTLHKGGKVQTRAATGELVHQLDDLQYTLGEGPCVDTLRHAQVVVAPRIRHDQRWPRYVPAALGLGLRSQLAVRLYLDDQGTLGGLNLYSTTSDDVAPRQRGPLSFSPPTPPSPSAMPANARTSTKPCSRARSSARPSASSWNATPSTRTAPSPSSCAPPRTPTSSSATSPKSS